MYQSPNDFDFEANDDLNNDSSNQELTDENNFNNLSTKSLVQRKKQLEKLFIYLIGFGVGLGLVLALLLMIVLNRFGLTKKPYEIESQPQQTETLELDGV
ncbi:MAG: hypothetical protein QNJ32_09480 [Xenococcaceae cyanobacterium MO_167.B27]|nr:hypothetical protein [Xenococcaceae cyanobacterium MO_167.B27]